MPRERSRPPLDRDRLPAEFTPETVRGLDLRAARLLADPRNGVLTADEQVAFDRSLRAVMGAAADRLDRPLRGRHLGPAGVDPSLRRSYQRTQQRLDQQAELVRRAFPQLVERDDEGDPGEVEVEVDRGTPGNEPAATVPAAGAEVDGELADEGSVGTLEAEIEQTSDTLEILEQIAAIQRQQLDHQQRQLLSETRGLFFAAAVSVAVIVAGIAPLVEASGSERLGILGLTALVCGVAAAVYAVVRARQNRSG